MPSPTPIDATLVWTGGLTFDGRTGSQQVTLDSDGKAGVTPVQALALALAGCMSMDVAAILSKGRHPMTALEVRLAGHRVENPPRRFTGFTIHVVVAGEVPEDAVARAIELSRDKYCAVWHSLRQDITLDTSFEIR